MSSSAVYNKHSTNTFEATVGDKRIKGRTNGAVAMASPESADFFARMKLALGGVQLSPFEISASKTADAAVSAKFHVEFNGHEYKQKLFLSRGGVWNPDSPGQSMIDIGKDQEIKQFCLKIAGKARSIVGGSDWGYTKNGNPIPPEDMVLKQVTEVLKPNIKAANDRLVVEVRNVLMDPGVQAAARRAYEDVIRDRVHEVLKDFESVGPDALHRFVDELYCKKIHDS